MQPNEYQKLADRTVCDQSVAAHRMYLERPRATKFLHSIIGLSGEVGELAATAQKWLWYGQPLDVVNVEEELGDVFWYLAECCNALGLDMEWIMKKNIAKLKRRYPERYTDELAKEENRNRAAERQEIEKGS